MTGMRTAYLVGCAFVAMAMVVCWLYLPSHAPEPEAEPEADDLDRELAEALAVTDA